jgi:hypothetical protein
MPDAYKPFGLRLPPEVKNWLAARAAGNERSMNAEIISILKALMNAEGPSGIRVLGGGTPNEPEGIAR